MTPYTFAGFAPFLFEAARRAGHPEAEGPARKIIPLTALANLCAQAGQAAPAHAPAILAKAGEYRDQLHAAATAADLILDDVRRGLGLDGGPGREAPPAPRPAGSAAKKSKRR